jgi:hypothetical protein
MRGFDSLRLIHSLFLLRVVRLGAWLRCRQLAGVQPAALLRLARHRPASYETSYE